MTKCIHFFMLLPVEGKWRVITVWKRLCTYVMEGVGDQKVLSFRNVECVDLMINEGCSINAKDKLGRYVRG